MSIVTPHRPEIDASDYEERQVFDIPAILLYVTLPRAEIKIWHRGGHENQGNFPDGVTQSVQYGNFVTTWASYFSNQHGMNVERTAQIFEDLVKHRVSEAPILKANDELFSVCF